MNGLNTSWLESLITTTANAYSTVKSADALKSQAAGQDNGQFQTDTMQGSAGGISPILLIGGAVLLIMFMKD